MPFGIFGKRKTLEEQLKEHKRSIDRSIRELDRERAKLQRQEQQCIVEIKKMAKAGQTNAAKIMAKDLVRTRKNVDKFYRMKTQLQAVSLRLQTLKSTQALTNVMQKTAQAMGKMNAQLNLPGLQRTMMQFEQQNEMMNSKQEMVDDTLDDVFAEDDEEEETEEVVNAVFQEIGLDIDGSLPNVANNPSAVASTQQSSEDTELMQRLEQLRK
ncbi:hypothetical protein GEMRC1_003121 [Eukaryota sp. GEM-RC1]